MDGVAVQRGRGRQRSLLPALWTIWWARALAILTLLVAMPVSQQVVDGVASVLVTSAEDDCGDDCDCSGCAPGECAHCLGCVPTPTLPVDMCGVLGNLPFSQASTLAPGRVALTLAHGLGPFRPPTA
jgi:hypothetical protein